MLTWKVPYAPYNTLFEAILPKHLLENDAKEILTYDAYNRSPIGTGPFMFAEWKAGEYIRVVKNPDYWRGQDTPSWTRSSSSSSPTTTPPERHEVQGRRSWPRLPAQPGQGRLKDHRRLHDRPVSANTSWNPSAPASSDRSGKMLFGDPERAQGHVLRHRSQEHCHRT